MTRRTIAAGSAALLLLAAACGDDGGAAGDSAAADKPDTITVWLQPEAESGWPELLESVNAEFTASTGIEVDIQTQQWGDHLTKLDTALSGDSPPDVVELGNTETTKYLAAGAFADLTEHTAEFENSGTWVAGMTESCTYDAKLMCIPYYGGSRAVIYNMELFEQAGITSTPTSLDEMFAAADTLMSEFGSDPNFSAFYMPGKYSKAALSFVADQGGTVAVNEGGEWTGALDSPESIAGLTLFEELVDKYSRADKTGDDTKQDATFAQGSVAMMYGLSWEPSAIIDPSRGGNPEMEGKIGVFPMPSQTAGETMPVFLGGSNLAIPVNSPNQEWAREWLAIYTNSESQTALAGTGLVPNSTALLDAVSPDAKPFAAGAANTWFTPIAPNWATVESQGVLEDMLIAFLTDEASVEEAAKRASTQITDTLNGS